MRHSLFVVVQRFLLLVFAVAISASLALGQISTTKDILQQKSQWKKIADEGRKLTFEARFHSRGADTFRVDKLDVDFRLPGSIRLPERLRDGQRLDVTGKFMSNSGRISFLVSALVVRDTDLDHMAKEVAAIPKDQPQKLLDVAREFASIAEFYENEDLSGEVAVLRTQAVEQQRLLTAGSLEALQKLIETAKALNVDSRLQVAMSYELLVVKATKPDVDQQTMIVELKSLEAWDRSTPEIPERLRSGFPATAIASYNSGTDEDRKWLHRLLYSYVRRRQIGQMLKTDGSNGLALAELIRVEFPEEPRDSATFEESEIKYQLGRVPDLSRKELQQLVELLAKASHTEKSPVAIKEWLTAQERRFGTSELAGMIRVADEHLFASEQWKLTEPQKKGIELLKKALGMAVIESPADASQIADRLKRLGWEQVNGQWMTSQQVGMLPKDDIQVAIREGRVVKGMTVKQVTQALGQPARISRMSSSRSMRELWIYDSTGSAGLVVRFRRSLVSKSEENLVEDVSKISAAGFR